MSTSYYQFCPVAKAMELLDERWTLLVVRELLSGSERFSELRRGVPRMSPSLLSKRLQQLTRAGIIERSGRDGSARYLLTPAGLELRPVVEALGTWGVRWIGELGDEDLDPKLLLWDMHRHVDHDAIGKRQVVVEFDFPKLEAKLRHWWLVINADDADVCDADPGFPVTLRVTADLRRLVEVWRGDRSWSDALRIGTVRIDGPEASRRGMPRWFSLPVFATVARPA